MSSRIRGLDKNNDRIVLVPRRTHINLIVTQFNVVFLQLGRMMNHLLPNYHKIISDQ